MISPTHLRWGRLCLVMGLVCGVCSEKPAAARTQYYTELAKLLAEQSDAEIAGVANRLKCRMCHTTEPAGRPLNVFGEEMARVLGRETDVADRRSIQVALHRAVFVLKNRKSAGPSSSVGARATVRKRYVGTVLKEDSRLSAYEMPLSDVLRVLGENHEISIQTDSRALERAGISPDAPVSLAIADVPLQSLLKFLLAEHHLTYDIKDNGLVVRPLETDPRAATSRQPARKTANAPAADLANALRRYVGRRIQIVEKDGSRLSETLLKLHESQDGELDAVSVFSTKSSSGKRYLPLSEIKEIRYLNQSLYSQPETNDPIVARSRELEQEVLLRERANRRERLQAAYRRQVGLERVAESVRQENERGTLNPRDAAELGDTEQVVRALATAATDQAPESRPADRHPPESATTTQPTEPRRPYEPAERPDNTAAPAAPRTESRESVQPEPSRPPLPRKTVIVIYRTTTGQPPALRYGTRIRYATEDSNDPKVQQAQLNKEGRCELDVPEDVQSIQVYTTPFGGSEGSHPLEAKGTTTITIQIEGV